MGVVVADPRMRIRFVCVLVRVLMRMCADAGVFAHVCVLLCTCMCAAVCVLLCTCASVLTV